MLAVCDLYTIELVLVEVYERWTHVQLAKSKKGLKAKGSYDKNTFQNKDVTKESRNK
jgi:hypothetical protein